MLAIFEFSLSDPEESVRLATITILSNLLEHDSSVIRAFCLSQSKDGKHPLVKYMIDIFFEENEPAIMSQYADLIKILLDTTGVGGIEVIDT